LIHFPFIWSFCIVFVSFSEVPKFFGLEIGNKNNIYFAFFLAIMNTERQTKRQRRKPQDFYSGSITTAEEKLVAQAIANSRVDIHRPQGNLDIPHAPTFYPTIEEFSQNPMTYINSISPIAKKFGICKIVPPIGWQPPLCVDINSDRTFQTKRQHLHRLMEGISFPDGEDYTPKQYKEMANEAVLLWRDLYYNEIEKESEPDVNLSSADGSTPQTNSNLSSDKGCKTRKMTAESLEQDYWDIVERNSKSYTVDYGNDIDTTSYWSGFPLSERGRAANGTSNKKEESEPEFGSEDFYKESWWNLNNFPYCPGSVLRHLRVSITGVNVPWLYFGTLFSTFCWHNEDNYMYSINYHHVGSPKQWYGVPGTKRDAEGLEKVFRNYLSMRMRDIPDLLHHITTMFSPRLLQQAHVPVYKLLQHSGEFVVTFPRSYHGGFSMGPNIGEAVNFANPAWISHGADASEKYRGYARPAVFSHHRIAYTMANHLEEYSLGSCEQLLKEMKRIMDEELRLRKQLYDQGVRDVSNSITLPKNRVDFIDESSADYDDKRLCHTCKHVCFFSAVACECSQRRVSCLRHSHLLCKCGMERKYLMVWENSLDMEQTLKNLVDFCKNLTNDEIKSHLDEENQDLDEIPIAPGVMEDLERHEKDTLPITLDF